jgi:ribosomal-protein-alanine N-acetyltransferase
VTVREATRADLLGVFRIEKASFPQPWPYRAFERFLGEPGFLVATGGGAAATGTGGADVRGTDAGAEGTGSGAGSGIAGYVVADATPNHGRPLGHVKDLAVAPDRRGAGIGATLLERVLATLAAHAVKLEVRADNEPALALYRRFGFTVRNTVPGYYVDGEDALVMVRDATE